MTGQHRSDGPGKGAFNVLKRIACVTIGIIETRLRLAVIELEEARASFIQLLIMAGISLLLATLSLISLLILTFMAIDPAWRLTALATTTAILLLLALIAIRWTLVKASRSKLLSATRQQLEIDRALLEKDS